MKKKQAEASSSLNQVTSVSKILAAVLFIVLPFAAFAMGMQFERMVTEPICGYYASK